MESEKTTDRIYALFQKRKYLMKYVVINIFNFYQLNLN